ncbi:MAG: SDR family oxidoreductase [Rhodospirillaceae bacterium]|nr:SDR family oxidoreductase [Rhodospirillaceae bacterium]
MKDTRKRPATKHPASKRDAAKRLAVVTGANRGIGLEIVRQLAQKGMRVVLTARDPRKGRAAAKTLQDDGLDVTFHKLDVADAGSIASFARWLRKTEGRLDVLVNNAGIYLDVLPDRSTESAFVTNRRKLRTTMEVNLEGPFFLMQTLIPLMRENGYGRIVNVSSGSGQLTDMGGHEAAYRISKTALNAATSIFAAETKGTGILVNAFCPGWVRTDMSGPEAPRSVAQGADTAVWLATLPKGGPTGGYFRDREPLPW